MKTLLIILLIILFAGEFFSYKGIDFLTKELPQPQKAIWRVVYWGWTLTVLGFVVYALLNREQFNEPKWMNFAFVVIGLFLANFFFKTIFGFIHFTNESATFFANYFSKPSPSSSNAPLMSRSRFLSLAGLAIASVPFAGLLYGMVRGRYQFRVVRQPLLLNNLPSSFVGKTILQISDLHLGSFPQHTKQVAKAVEKMNALNPDYVFFTGDMINERAIEAEPWIHTLKQIKAKSGKFSVLGNHDYGDYYSPWKGDPEKIEENVLHLKQIQEQMGFHMLRNENTLLQQGSESIRLIGLENWGKGHFSKHGDLQKATADVADEEVQILLSHDPSHWDARVLGKTAIDIALAGHTHGSQMGVEVPGFQWSPVQYRYPRWAGLYKEKNQQLYVNRGLGYIGYAGRIGIWPEITLFELQKA